MVEWNDTKTDYPKDKCIHELFEEQVERSPDAMAVVFEDQQLTYRELNNRANQLAHYLQRLGSAPKSRRLCLDRSIEMIIGISGMFKAGGAYLPIDPTYPAERLQFMIQDTQVRLFFTQRKARSAIVRFSGTSCVWKATGPRSGDENQRILKPMSLLITWLTSSTPLAPQGLPKGCHINVS